MRRIPLLTAALASALLLPAALGAAAAGTVMCLSTLATSTPADVAAAAPDAPRWFQLYVFRDRGVTR